jgi:uncharacterized zinc-type alcohol dehydrogenase-like protein
MENNHGLPGPREDEYREIGWGLLKKGEKFVPMWINRYKPREHDIKFDILYSGICHSDCTIADDLIGQTKWPFVPGHEFVGRVTEVGSAVTKAKVGQMVGVGCFVDKCDTCGACVDKEEAYCDAKVISINAAKTGKRVGGNPDTYTEGGYSATHVVHEDFAFVIPADLDITQAAPILCGGITMYDPLKHWGCLDGKKKTVGIIGVGGLGTMGIKLARAMGHDVVAISTTSAKEQMSKEKGATAFVASKDPESIKAQAGKCNLILNTISANHDLNVYLPLLARDGVIV